jgi:hypothetical protein
VSVRLSSTDRVAEAAGVDFRVCFGDLPRTHWGGAHSLLFRRFEDHEFVDAEALQSGTLECHPRTLTYDGSVQDTRARGLNFTRIDNLRACFRLAASTLDMIRPPSFTLRFDVVV